MVDLAAAVGTKVRKFKVGDVEVRFKPRVKDVSVMMAVAAKMDKGEFTQEDINAMLDAVVSMIERAYSKDEIDRESIEVFVVEHLEDVINGIAETLGFAAKNGGFRGK